MKNRISFLLILACALSVSNFVRADDTDNGPSETVDAPTAEQAIAARQLLMRKFTNESIKGFTNIFEFCTREHCEAQLNVKQRYENKWTADLLSFVENKSKADIKDGFKKATEELEAAVKNGGNIGLDTASYDDALGLMALFGKTGDYETEAKSLKVLSKYRLAVVRNLVNDEKVRKLFAEGDRAVWLEQLKALHNLYPNREIDQGIYDSFTPKSDPGEPMPTKWEWAQIIYQIFDMVKGMKG